MDSDRGGTEAEKARAQHAQIFLSGHPVVSAPHHRRDRVCIVLKKDNTANLIPNYTASHNS